MLATKTSGSRSTPSKLLGSPVGELKFRVQGGQHHGRLIRITAAKCTIGSAPGCTLRLRAGDVDPLHCLILCGRNGTVIRRNSRRTYLNGGPFDDSPLKAGDLLQIASIELVVVDCPCGAAETPLAETPQNEAALTQVFTPTSKRREIQADEIVARTRQEAQQEIQRLEKEKEERRLEQIRLADELSKVTQQLCQAREQLEKASHHQKQHEEQQLEQSRLASELSEVSQQLHQAREEGAEMRTRLAILEVAAGTGAAPQSHSQALEAAREEIARLRALRRADEEQWAATRQEIELDRSALAERLQELERKNKGEQNTSQSVEAALLAETKLQESTRRCQFLEQELSDARRQMEEQLSRASESQVSEEQVERWQAEAHQWHLQVEQVTKELGELREARARLEAKVAELQVAAQARPQAESQRQEIEEARQQLDSRQLELDLARKQLQEERGQFVCRVSETVRREENLAKAEAQIREREAAWEADQQRQAAVLEERSQLIAQQIEQFEAERTAFARQQTTLIQQITSLEDRVQELTAAASESRATNPPLAIPRSDDSAMGLDSAPADQSSPRAQAEEEGAKQHESEQPAPQKPKYKPTSFLEQAAELARQEELALARGEAPPDHAGPPVGSQTLVMPADPDSARAHSEDSIEQYMAKLLNRVRTSAEARESGNSESEDKPADAAANTADESPADESKEPEPPQPIVRRPSVPEAPEKLSQMRELANSAARSAIHAHAKQNANRVVKRKSRVAILSGIGAVGLGVVFCVTGSVPAIAGSLSFSVICFFMIVRAIQHSMRHMRLHPPGKPLVDEEAEEAKPVADSPPEQVSEAATEASESVVCVEGSSTSADTP